MHPNARPKRAIEFGIPFRFPFGADYYQLHLAFRARSRAGKISSDSAERKRAFSFCPAACIGSPFDFIAYGRSTVAAATCLACP